MADEKKTRRGRPEYKPTAGDRRRVKILASGRMSQERIAAALEISVETMLKYFADDLTTGKAKCDAEVLLAQHKSAIGGNVSAQKVWLQRADLLPPSVASAPAPEREPPALGKKVQAAIDAAVGAEGTDWADIVSPATSVPQ